MDGRRIALIVANDRYDNAELRTLPATVADATALRDVLGDARLGQFEVEVLANLPLQVVTRRIDQVLGARQPDDLVLLHFSCHGMRNEKHELFLAASDTDPELLSSTALDSAWVFRRMVRSRARRTVLFLDCCYGGAFEKGAIARSAPAIDVGDQFQAEGDDARGVAVVTASTAVQFAFEGGVLADRPERIMPSIFTGALVEGLRTGEADRDQDGRVSLDELYEYVYERVRQATPNQTPQKSLFSSQGELVIAMNPRRRVVPSALPEDVTTNLAAPSNVPRLGAVAVLTRLAGGSDMSLAAAARLELARVVEEDNYRDVAAAAADGLERSNVRLATDAIDVGEVEGGGETPVGTVEILGPPLALLAEVGSSTPAIRADRVDRAIEIRLGAADIGPIEGVVTVAIPGGVVELRVTGLVVARATAQPVAAAADAAGPAAAVGSAPPEVTGDVEPTTTRPPEAPPAADDAGREPGRSVREMVRPLVRSVIGWVAAGLLYFPLSAVDMLPRSGADQVPQVVLWGAVLTALVLVTLESAIPSIRIPAGSLWDPIGNRRVLPGAIEGLVIGIPAGVATWQGSPQALIGAVLLLVAGFVVGELANVGIDRLAAR